MMSITMKILTIGLIMAAVACSADSAADFDDSPAEFYAPEEIAEQAPATDLAASKEETGVFTKQNAEAKAGWHRWRPRIKTHFKKHFKRVSKTLKSAMKLAKKRAKMALNKHKKLRRYIKTGWSRFKKMKKTHRGGWAKLKKWGRKVAKKVKGGWGRFKKKVKKTTKKKFKKRGWGSISWGRLKKKFKKVVKKVKTVIASGHHAKTTDVNYLHEGRAHRKSDAHRHGLKKMIKKGEKFVKKLKSIRTKKIKKLRRIKPRIMDGNRRIFKRRVYKKMDGNRIRPTCKCPKCPKCAKYGETEELIQTQDGCSCMCRLCIRRIVKKIYKPKCDSVGAICAGKGKCKAMCPCPKCIRKPRPRRLDGSRGRYNERKRKKNKIQWEYGWQCETKTGGWEPCDQYGNDHEGWQCEVRKGVWGACHPKKKRRDKMHKYAVLTRGTCESAGMATIYGKMDCTHALSGIISGQKTISGWGSKQGKQWGPHGGYKDIVNGCSMRVTNGLRMLFDNPKGTCTSYNAKKSWAGNNCQCGKHNACICKANNDDKEKAHRPKCDCNGCARRGRCFKIGKTYRTRTGTTQPSPDKCAKNKGIWCDDEEKAEDEESGDGDGDGDGDEEGLWPVSKHCTWCNQGSWNYNVATQQACQDKATAAGAAHYTYKAKLKQCRIDKNSKGCTTHGRGYKDCAGNVHTKPKEPPRFTTRRV